MITVMYFYTNLDNLLGIKYVFVFLIQKEKKRYVYVRSGRIIDRKSCLYERSCQIFDLKKREI